MNNIFSNWWATLSALLIFLLLGLFFMMFYEYNAQIPSKNQLPSIVEITTVTGDRARQWILLWNDEFEGDLIDPTKWDFDLGNTLRGTNVPGWGNDEIQYYTNDLKNARVQDGYLLITALLEEDTSDYGGFRHTSARLVTRGLFYRTFGRFEFRAKLPVGTGLWPALWLLPEHNYYGTWAASGEIDVMEARGRIPEEVLGTIHFGAEWPNNVHSGGSYTFPAGQDITQFHTYSIEWEPGQIRWYVNDVHYHTENNWFTKDADSGISDPFPAPFDQPFHIIMNLAVGGRFDRLRVPADDVFPAVMKIDYVRVYSLKE